MRRILWSLLAFVPAWCVAGYYDIPAWSWEGFAFAIVFGWIWACGAVYGEG